MLTSKHKQLIRKWYTKFSEQQEAFKPRAAQNQLIADIARCIGGELNKEQRIMLAESGTGTGKSLAYLFAGIPLAKSLNKTLIVSTATVALQQQLIEAELPRVHRAAEGAFRFTLAKGRGRYCCRHKLERLIKTPPSHLKAPQLKLLTELAGELAANRWPGDRDSWSRPIPDRIWNQILSDGFSCTPQFATHRNCPFQKARQKLLSSDVIVVNHSLLLADLDAGGGIFLPPPDECIYVIDEAHLLPDIAREASSCKLDLDHLKKQLVELSPFLKDIENRVKSQALIAPALTIRESIASLTTLNNRLNDYALINRGEFKESVWRFSYNERPKNLSDLAHNHIKSAQRLKRALEQVSSLIQEAMEDSQLKSAIAEQLLSRMNQYALSSDTLIDSLYHYSRDDQLAPFAYWYQSHEGKHTLCSCPIEIGPKLYNILFEPAFSVIAVSATLTALGRFDFFLNQVGLHGRLPGSQQFINPSPFDYERVTLELPTNFDEPGTPNYPKQVAHFIDQHYQKGTSILLLCSSYAMVADIKNALATYQLAQVYYQGELSNQSLLNEHKKTIDKGEPSLIVATMGFSEGVDLPGNYLNHLIIARLPFAVPTDPIHQSHSELLESQGRNPFAQLTLPAASRKLIQCCGRLMRRESDSGIISILDQRITTRRYGQQLIAALPPYRK
jgi:ATP-dependent DNA helicase DinG